MFPFYFLSKKKKCSHFSNGFGSKLVMLKFVPPSRTPRATARATAQSQVHAIWRGWFYLVHKSVESRILTALGQMDGGDTLRPLEASISSSEVKD